MDGVAGLAVSSAVVLAVAGLFVVVTTNDEPSPNTASSMFPAFFEGVCSDVDEPGLDRRVVADALIDEGGVRDNVESCFASNVIIRSAAAGFSPT